MSLGSNSRAIRSIAEFKKKWGTQGWKLVIEEFIKRSPNFPGDVALAQEIGIVVADLEAALIEER